MPEQNPGGQSEEQEQRTAPHPLFAIGIGILIIIGFIIAIFVAVSPALAP